MKKIYACLIGNWECVNDDPECVIDNNGQSPEIWWEENAPVYAPIERPKNTNNSMYGLNYVNILYKGKNYRINPAFIQVVTE